MRALEKEITGNKSEEMVPVILYKSCHLHSIIVLLFAKILLVLAEVEENTRNVVCERSGTLESRSTRWMRTPNCNGSSRWSMDSTSPRSAATDQDTSTRSIPSGQSATIPIARTGRS